MHGSIPILGGLFHIYEEVIIMYNVGLWGLGSHAIKNLIPAIQQSPDCNLTGIWSRKNLDASLEKSFTEVKIYNSYQEMLGDETIDVIIISTPTGLHFEQGVEVLKSGKNLWCEKSLCSDSNEVEQLVKLAKANSLLVKEMFMFLHHPQFLKIKEILDSGIIGKVNSLYARFGFPHLENSNFRYNPDLGGGSLLDSGCYPIAASHSLFGGNPVDIFSTIFTDDGYEVDTSGAALLVYENGIKSILEWGFGLSYRNEIEIWGEFGVLKANRVFSKPNDFNSEIYLIDTYGNKEIINIPPTNHFIEMFSNFIKQKDDISWNLNQSKLMMSIRKNIHNFD